MDRKVIFDTVRGILGRGLVQADVMKLDQAIELAASPSTDGVSSPAEPFPREVSPAGIALIKQFEGCARVRADGLFEAYPDPGTGAEPWTLGWGATGAGVAPDTIWTQQECDDRLASDLRRYAADVSDALGGSPTTQAQFDALVCFHYNTGAIRRATLTRLHRAQDYAGAQAEFFRWNRAGGRVMKGLTRRRAAEAKLYSGG
ncbi:lysozyme [Allopontixanthobacter sp.]|uniref:lysozyme n=1 Tax=Allopontixanthobacter sp. TaxID=2906452 RepID=UPI002AB8C05B|nr:lysozyme [Allopontixanthobacter sp.]MDZ4306433.1 lysozyme [Allopontixanthobacter sp.]